MEPATVVGLVSTLVDTYAAGLDHYARWKRKSLQQNHYRHQRGPAPRSVPSCALSTSLSVAGVQIRETYNVACAIIGTEFSNGDG